MRALIVGGHGQLGQALMASAPHGANAFAVDIDTLDITDADSVRVAIEELSPTLVVNAAAYTAVDKAEGHEALARAVNGDAVGYLADAARTVGADFVHVSTDFVFDGHAASPYRTGAMPKPLSAYGRTKLLGEQLAGDDALIVRTAWLYGPTGSNFVRTMLRQMAGGTAVRVVVDQVGTPTYAPGLAEALWSLAHAGRRGMYHYTDAGVASWYDFAVAIQEEAVAIGLLGASVPVIPIMTADYPTPAIRPPVSVLDKTDTWAALGRVAPHWRANLRTMLSELKMHG